MKFIYLLIILPIIVATEMYLFSFITDMLSAKSDMAVLVGVILSIIFIFLNYMLINYTKKQLKN